MYRPWLDLAVRTPLRRPTWMQLAAKQDRMRQSTGRGLVALPVYTWHGTDVNVAEHSPRFRWVEETRSLFNRRSTENENGNLAILIRTTLSLCASKVLARPHFP